MRFMSFLFIFFTFLGFSEAEPVTRPHFYIVSKGNRTHYILGTFHYAVKFSDFPPVVHESFKGSTVFISEVSLNDSLKKTIWLKLEDLKNPPLPKLKEGHLEKLRRLGVADKLMPRSDDDSADAFIFYPFQGNYPFYIMDADIFFQAKEAGKKMLTLDTPVIIARSSQHGNNHTTGHSIAEILETRSVEQIRDWGKYSIDSYLSGPEKEKPSTDGGIIFRNKQWMPKILRYYKKNNQTFTAVGSAHLYGEFGLIEMLKRHGYKIYSAR